MAGEQQTNGTTRDFAAEAAKIGWKPKEEFRGDPERWVDAETYVTRGEEQLPLIQAANRTLRENVSSLEQRLLDQERINRANAKALEELTEANREQTAERAERTVEQIEAGIVAAREANDVQAELTLLREHATAVNAAAKAKEKPVVTQQQSPADLTKTPAFQQFLQDNPWFNADPVMRAASFAIREQLQAEGKLAGKSQAEYLEMVAEGVRKRFNVADDRRPNTNRVEGGGGPGSGTSQSTGKTYDDLPSEAKAACDKTAKRLQFGEGKRYKNLDAWRKQYVDTYYST